VSVPFMNTDEKNAWADFLEFAAALYLNEPDEERLDKCREVGLNFREFFPEELFAKMLVFVDRDPCEEVRQEYFDLFFVPISGRYLPPFEAAHRERSMAAELPVSVQNFYGCVGFKPEKLEIPSYVRMLNRPDHSGFEMAFMGLMLKSPGQFDLDGKREQAKALFETARCFHSRHLGSWASHFGKKLTETADCHLYKALGHLTMFIDRGLDEILHQ